MSMFGNIALTYQDLFSVIIDTLPVILLVSPFFLGFLAWEVWLSYIRDNFIKNIEWMLLEVKLPREITQTPKSMEVILAALYQSSDGNIIDKYIKGKVRGWFTLEIVSIGGNLHFYIHTPKSFRNMIEAQIYAQYPGVEVYEADDYTKVIPYGLPGSDWQVWGTEFEFTKADPYPIKTYVDYELDKVNKEENKIDPISTTLETMGSIKPGEQIWFQLLIMASKPRFAKKGAWFGKQDWTKEAEDLLSKLLKRDKKAEADVKILSPELTLSPGEKKIVEAIERSISKYGFDTGVRAVYLAKGDTYNKGMVPAIVNMVRQYNTGNLNGFKPARRTDIEYPWQDMFGTKIKKMKWKIFDAYVRRSYFYSPYKRKPIVLTTEELATLYHFPGLVAATPTLPRIESKRGEPPANLPF